MMPGMDMGKLKKLMKDMEQIDAQRVIIEKEGSKLIIERPQVTKINMMGQETYQIVGQAEEVKEEKELFSDEDVTMVIEQTGSDEETVRETLIKNSGDIAKTILDLKG
jgi:nascent polypeptide-associated complex subunit alpha